MSVDSKRILVLYWTGREHKLRPTIWHHLRSFRLSPRRHQVVYYDITDGVPARLGQFRFDVVILHYTVLCLRWYNFELVRRQLQWLRAVPAFKIAVPQDEYDHNVILDEWLNDLGVGCIFSCFDECQQRSLYPIMHDRALFVQCLTGYIDETIVERCARFVRRAEQRPFDIVYRGRHLPYWYGRFGQVKHLIAVESQRCALQLGLRHDISTREQDVLLGDDWFRFLASGRATIGCESGVSSLDPRGELRRRSLDILRENPSMSFDEFGTLMPPGWDIYQWRALGPRHLEAVMTRTVQILVQGDYNGVLQPHRHYIPVKADFSNLSQAFDQVRDIERMEEIADCAYEEIGGNKRYHYSALADLLDKTIEMAESRGWLPVPRKCGVPLQIAVTGVKCLEQTARAGTHLRLALGRIRTRLRGIIQWPDCHYDSASRVGWVPKVAELAKGFLSYPELRDVVRACLLEWWRYGALQLRTIVRDVIRLKLLLDITRLAQQGTLQIWLEFDNAAGLLCIVVLPGQNAPMADILSTPTVLPPSKRSFSDEFSSGLRMGKVRALIWDNSAVGMILTQAQGVFEWEYAVGVNGKYFFNSLVHLATRYPALVIQLLRAITPEAFRTNPSSLQGQAA